MMELLVGSYLEIYADIEVKVSSMVWNLCNMYFRNNAHIRPSVLIHS
jgi:hypothetical protein